MKVTLENEKENVVKLNITVPAVEATNAYNLAVRRISQYVNIDGFRKGKAPRQVVETQVGKERIKQEAIENLMPKVINDAINENNLDVITQPYITSYDFELGKDLNVSVHVETRPEVKLGEYKGLNVEVEDTPVSDEAFDKALENIKNQYAEEKMVLDSPANADIVNINFEGFSNGEKIKGGEAKSYRLDLGHSTFIPGFAEQIVGKNLNDDFEIEVTFPEDYHDEKLKGQKATFKIHLNEIKERVIPEITDEFAQRVGKFNNVDELKDDVKKYLENARENANKNKSENEVFKKVIEAAEVEIPQSMVDREADSLLADYKNRLAAQGISWDMVAKTQNEEELMKNIQDDAKLRIKNSLVIDKIAKVENIKLSPSDLDKKFQELGAAYGVSQQDIMKQISKNPEILGSLSQQAINDKVKEFLMENNKVEVVAPKAAK